MSDKQLIANTRKAAMVSPMLGALLLIGCATESPPIQQELTLDEQLENAYAHCRNDGIVDLTALQDILNAGGGGLSAACIDALGQLDFEQLVADPEFSLDFDAPIPSNVLNPLRQDRSWHQISSFDKESNLQYFSSGLDTDIASKIKVTGIAPDGSTVALHNFILQNIDPDDVVVNFLTDYSTSMQNADLFKMSDYFKHIYAGFPDGVATRAAVFSEAVKVRSDGFSTDYNHVQEALGFDYTYLRGGTALYDSWSFSIVSLFAESKPIKINILMTDGFENASAPRSRSTLKSLIEETGVFNIVIATTWAEPVDLNDIIGENGFVAFKYQIEQAQTIIADIAQALRNMRILKVEDNLDGLDGIRLEYGNEAKLLIPIH